MITNYNKDAYGRVTLYSDISGQWYKSPDGGLTWVALGTGISQQDYRPTVRYQRITPEQPAYPATKTSVVFTGSSVALIGWRTAVNFTLTLTSSQGAVRTVSPRRLSIQDGYDLSMAPGVLVFGINDLEYDTWTMEWDCQWLGVSHTRSPDITEVIYGDFKSSYASNVLYRCVSGGVPSEIAVDPSVPRQASVNATITKFVQSLEAGSVYPGGWAFAEAASTIGSMYYLCTDSALKSRLLNLIYNNLIPNLIPPGDDRAGYGQHWLYTVTKNAPGAESLTSFLFDYVNQQMTVAMSKGWNMGPTPNWATPLWLLAAILYSDPDYPLWYHNPAVWTKLQAALDSAQDQAGTGMIGPNGEQGYYLGPLDHSWTGTEGSMDKYSYTLFQYQQFKVAARVLGWRPALVDKTSKWIGDMPQYSAEGNPVPLAEPFLYFDGAYGGQEPVSIFQRIHAYYNYYKTIPRDVVDLLYSAAFDTNEYCPEWDIPNWRNFRMYAPEGFSPSSVIINKHITVPRGNEYDGSYYEEESTEIESNAENWHLFYAVQGLVMDGVPSALWAWSGLPDYSVPAGTPQVQAPLHHVAKGGGSHHFSKGGNHHLE